ncbi:MAG: SMC-Scp complex subunit ScpB [Armatimonadetes bacterium]|nr:SMC-Scp complex subunit ScpB [Armatimonadota bacterium]
MDNKDEMNNGQQPEITDVVSMEPIEQAPLASVAEAVEEQVVISKPKKGLGLAAFFSRGKHSEVAEQMYDASYADINDAGPVQSTVAQVPSQDIDYSTDAPECFELFDNDDTSLPAHKNGQLMSVLECMLFVSDGPLTSQQAANMLDTDLCEIEDALTELEAHLENRGGIRLMRLAGGYQLCTDPDYAEYCTMLLQPGKKRLSKAALETLAVVAYRQPCTLPEVEAVRGVAVDGVMRTLSERGLVKEAGRKQTPGRPILYATTPEFLEYFGLNDLSELPDIDLLAVEEVKILEARRDMFAGDAQEPEEE